MKESGITQRPDTGCYISGLFIEGARWSYTDHELAESRAKELYTEMPIIWLKPFPNRVKPTEGIYDCPVYKTLTRAGKKGVLKVISYTSLSERYNFISVNTFQSLFIF